MGLSKLFSLTVFQSFFLLFVTFDIMLERHICRTKSYVFVIYKLFSSPTLSSVAHKKA